jgi:hypothetical protein
MARTLIKTIKDDAPVGAILHSNLTEAQFQAEQGAGWVLADGRSVTGSRYETVTGNANIPDLRGRFLRGKNNGRNDGLENPGGELNLGQNQSEATAVNGLSASTTGTALAAGNHDHATQLRSNAVFGTRGLGNVVSVDTQTQGSTTTAAVNETSNEGEHTHTLSASTSLSGDIETRSANTTVNYFIRIN